MEQPFHFLVRELPRVRLRFQLCAGADLLGCHSPDSHEGVLEECGQTLPVCVSEHLNQCPEFDSRRVRFDLLRALRRQIARPFKDRAFAVRVGQRESRMRVHNRCVSQVLDNRLPPPLNVRRLDLKLDSGAVWRIPVNFSLLENLWLIRARVNHQFAVVRRLVVTDLRDDSCRLPGAELRIQNRCADPDALLPPRLLQDMKT